MEASSIDNELMHYWTKLTIVQKESVLNVLKSFVAPDEATEQIDIEQYNKELAEAEAEIERGEFYTQEEVVQTIKKWINDKQKDQLV